MSGITDNCQKLKGGNPSILKTEGEEIPVLNSSATLMGRRRQRPIRWLYFSGKHCVPTRPPTASHGKARQWEVG